MTKIRLRGEQVRQFILENVEKHPGNIARTASERFDISRQAVNRHLKKLVEEGALQEKGKTRNRTYRLAPLERWTGNYQLTADLVEDAVWRDDLKPRLGSLPENVMDIWHYGFTEMLNNAIDHSGGSQLIVAMEKTALATNILLIDNGEGIFKKIQRVLGLLDERHAVLELAKGKLTTDPDNHTGEGIFFTSRMYDKYNILSGGVFFSHKLAEDGDWILENEYFASGTVVGMWLNNHTTRTAKRVFDKFTSGDDFGFTKTIVPVRLTQYGDDKLVSRSQAKRLLSRIDRFRTVILDFDRVDSIGQAFADEVFRVFPAQHPDIELRHIKADSAVKRMILRAKSNRV